MRATLVVFTVAAVFAADSAAAQSTTCPTATFGSHQGYGAGTGERGLAVGDFNQDGSIDIIVIARTSNSLLFLHGFGTGSFAVTSGSGVPLPEDVDVADFDGDGVLDAAVVNGSDDATPGSATIMLGRGTGLFSRMPSGASLAGAVAGVAGDFTGDGDADLVVVGGPPASNGSILAARRRRPGQPRRARVAACRWRTGLGRGRRFQRGRRPRSRSGGRGYRRRTGQDRAAARRRRRGLRPRRVLAGRCESGRDRHLGPQRRWTRRSRRVEPREQDPCRSCSGMEWAASASRRMWRSA